MLSGDQCTMPRSRCHKSFESFLNLTRFHHPRLAQSIPDQGCVIAFQFDNIKVHARGNILRYLSILSLMPWISYLREYQSIQIHEVNMLTSITKRNILQISKYGNIRRLGNLNSTFYMELGH